MTNDEIPTSSDTRADGAAPVEIRHSKFVIPLFAWVAAGFLFLGLLWTGMVIATRQVDIRTVPLATKETKP